MPKTGDLLRRLQRAGFILLRHGGSHDIYSHPTTGRRVVVPRHGGDVPKGTYRSILKDAGLTEDDTDD